MIEATNSSSPSPSFHPKSTTLARTCTCTSQFFSFLFSQLQLLHAYRVIFASVNRSCADTMFYFSFLSYFQSNTDRFHHHQKRMKTSKKGGKKSQRHAGDAGVLPSRKKRDRRRRRRICRFLE